MGYQFTSVKCDKPLFLGVMMLIMTDRSYLAYLHLSWTRLQDAIIPNIHQSSTRGDNLVNGLWLMAMTLPACQRHTYKNTDKVVSMSFAGHSTDYFHFLAHSGSNMFLWAAHWQTCMGVIQRLVGCKDKHSAFSGVNFSSGVCLCNLWLPLTLFSPKVRRHIYVSSQKQNSSIMLISNPFFTT